MTRRSVVRVRRTRRQEAGQGLVEYGLILVLIAIVAILSLIFIGGDVSTLLSQIGSSV
jgi:Flp pilus assembly pilin Flp